MIKRIWEMALLISMLGLCSCGYIAKIKQPDRPVPRITPKPPYHPPAIDPESVPPKHGNNGGGGGGGGGGGDVPDESEDVTTSSGSITFGVISPL